jgi:hypothetical protein
LTWRSGNRLSVVAILIDLPLPRLFRHFLSSSVCHPREVLNGLSRLASVNHINFINSSPTKCNNDEMVLPFPTLNPQPSTLNPQPSTLNPQPSNLNPQPSTLNFECRCSAEAGRRVMDDVRIAFEALVAHQRRSRGLADQALLRTCRSAGALLGQQGPSDQALLRTCRRACILSIDS